MKAKIIILTPVYNDWKNLSRLLKKINKIFENQLKTKFELIIINDCSTEKYNPKKYKCKMASKITIISLYQNVGSQRAIAIGIKYLSKFYKKKIKTLIIDSDGQDNPSIISKLINMSDMSPQNSIAVRRRQRKEPVWFKIFYELYCFLIIIFSYKKIRFGNFSLLNFVDLKKVSIQNDLWSAYPPTLSNTINNLNFINADREKRFGGKSKMNFFGLIFHALRVFSALKVRIFFISSFYFVISYLLFFNKYNLYFIFLSFSILTLNLTNFIISFRNKEKFLENFRKIKINRIF